MSVRKETYLIKGFKFEEKFTKDFWDKDFYDDLLYFSKKDSDEIKFLTDGMNGNYTFFGQIIELGTRGDWYEDQIKEIDPTKTITSSMIVEKFKELYPDSELKAEDVKLYYVPHYV